MPFPLSVKVKPAGNAPASEIAAAGYPLLVTVKLPALPTVKVVEAALVMAGASSTVTVVETVALSKVMLSGSGPKVVLPEW